MMWTGFGFGEVLLHGAGNFVGRAGPDLDELLAALRVGDQAAARTAAGPWHAFSSAEARSPALAGGATTSEKEMVTPERDRPAEARAP